MTTSPPSARSSAVALAGLALVVAGLGVGLIAWDLPAAPVQVADANQPVNASATDPADVTTHNSPALAANPTDPANLAIASRIDGPEAGCAVHTSTDGGGSWEPTDVPIPDRAADDGEGGQPACFAPDVAFGPEGTLYLAFTTIAGLRNQTTGAWVATSPDGGQTFTEPARVAGGRPFQVSVAADPTQPDRVYVAWLAAVSEPGSWGFVDPDNPVQVARSNDAGTSWTEPTTVSANEHTRALAPTLAVADGEVAIAYLDLGDDQMDYHGDHDGQGGPAYDGTWTLALARSGDDGASWTQATVTNELVPHRRLIAFFPPTPALALADDGTAYTAFHDARRGGADVWLWTRPSRDSGFGEPVRVNDTGFDEQTAQYLPQLALTPEGDRLEVVYYDRRDDPDNVFTHTSWQATATDGEVDFTPSRHLSDEAFDARIGPGSERNLATLGSHLALTATGQRSTAVWADTRAAPEAAAKQDLASTHVTHSTAARWRLWLLLAAVIAVVAGVIVIVRWAQTRRHHTTPPPPARQPTRR